MSAGGLAGVDRRRARAGRLARLVPLGLVGRQRAQVLVERNVALWTRRPAALLAGALEPVLYLLAIGVGVGGLVGDVRLPSGAAVSYGEFAAPALMVSAAMNGAIFETFNVYFKLRHARLYDAVLATPLGPRDLVAGELAWTVARATLYAVLFLVGQLALGLVASPLAVLSVPVAALTGFAFGGMTLAATTYMRSWRDFDWVEVVMVPLFLFSATFYPLTVLPGWAATLTQLSPLYHAVAAARGLAFGEVQPALLLHLGVLLGLGVAGAWLAQRRFARLLLH